MPNVDFTQSVGYAAAQARERALQAQRQALANQAQLDQSGIVRGSTENLTSAVDEFSARKDLERKHAFDQAQAEGTEAGYMGQPMPEYTTDEMNRGAATGGAAGRMSMGQALVKRQDAATAAQAGMTRDMSKADYEHQLSLDPATQTMMLERIRARNKGLVDAASAGNPALTKGAQTEVDKKFMAGAGRIMGIRNARAQLSQFSEDDFNLKGGALDLMRQGARFVGADKTSWMQALDPQGQQKMAQVDTWRSGLNRSINGLLLDDSGKAVTDNEFQRKMQELNTLWGGGAGLMFNNKASMDRALGLAEELELQLQRYRDQARRGNVLPTTDGAGYSAPTFGVDPDADGALDDGADDIPIQPGMEEGGVSEDGRTINYNAPAGESEYLAPTLPPLQTSGAFEGAQSPTAAPPGTQPSPYRGGKPPAAKPQTIDAAAAPKAPKAKSRPRRTIGDETREWDGSKWVAIQ